MKGILALLFFLLVASRSEGNDNANKKDIRGWLYCGGKSRLISFAVKIDKAESPGLFNPVQKSGYILLREDGFSITSASIIGTSTFSFEGGKLRIKSVDLIRSGDDVVVAERSTTYKEALIASFAEGISQSLSVAAQKVLELKNGGAPPKKILEDFDKGVMSRAEFGSDWTALKVLSWSLPALGKGPGARIKCEFEDVNKVGYLERR